MPKTEPRIIVKVPSREAAQRQYWRHVANRACLALLADQRHPILTARQGSTKSTRPPLEPPRPGVGSDVFRVRAEPIQIELPGETLQTDWLELDMLVKPELLSQGNRLTLEVLREWPAPKSSEVLFRYWETRHQLVRRDGLSGDVVYLFEILLYPFAADLLEAMGFDLYQCQELK